MFSGVVVVAALSTIYWVQRRHYFHLTILKLAPSDVIDLTTIESSRQMQIAAAVIVELLYFWMTCVAAAEGEDEGLLVTSVVQVKCVAIDAVAAELIFPQMMHWKKRES